jgi:hypothetical protein
VDNDIPGAQAVAHEGFVPEDADDRFNAQLRSALAADADQIGMAGRFERRHQMGADESTRAGDEYAVCKYNRNMIS